MPLYDYACSDCGPFRAFRPMAESDRAQPCPGCGVARVRSLTTPYLSGGGGGGSSGWLPRAGAAPRPGGSWRKACGLGCGIGCVHAR